ncbi:MAG TPA: FAD-binding protein [Desulfovibrio sp.]|uniref:FAD-binding protein n=1 Tax=Desulfovibrio sp. TaxID=885 RepID=UPI002A3A5F8F|nr:FAD-binding protein [Desulfovibrio sp.]MDY0305367.1 FAD-binding protein [Desulfovibrionaceae bacterium]HMM39918.1 FAD-binding protein [Desulfovibrio sp.]
MLRTDILVIGSGLAGLRAALAARAADSRLTVHVLSPSAGPSGSSFANRNDCLGMQIPDPDDAGFDAEVLRLAAPGFADPTLVRLPRLEARARLDDLLRLGLDFRRAPDGSLEFLPGCFSATPRAVIFNGLARAHALFRGAAEAAGVRFLGGLTARELVVADGRAAGARFMDRDGGEVDVSARAVILAAGGPAPLFERSMCGPGNDALSYGLLERAGARLANAGFVQFFWNDAGSGRFVQPGVILRPGTVLHGPRGGLTLTAGHPALAQAEARVRHCPAGYGLPDAILDELLLAHAEEDGVVRLTTAEGVEMGLAFCAHAGNGGAVVDADGMTGVSGLFACGECATGMHGANRLGGGMVLATQVFGFRAGVAAARLASGASRPSTSAFNLLPPLPPSESPALLERLRRGMQRHCLFGPRPGLRGFVRELEGMARTSPSACSALILARALLPGA